MLMFVFLYLLGLAVGLAFWTGVRLRHYQVSRSQWLCAFVPGLNLAFLVMAAVWWVTRDRYVRA